MMSQDQKTEVEEAAEAAALFFAKLVKEGVPAPMAVQLTGTWILSKKVKDQNDDGWRDP